MWEKIDQIEQDIFPKCEKRAGTKKKKKTCPSRKTSMQWGVGDFDEKIGERNKQNPR